MAFVDTMRIFKHWETYPPVRAFVAAFCGFKPPVVSDTSKHLTRDEFARLIAQTGGKLT
jgi:hypothetical protein